MGHHGQELHSVFALNQWAGRWTRQCDQERVATLMQSAHLSDTDAVNHARRNRVTLPVHRQSERRFSREVPGGPSEHPALGHWRREVDLIEKMRPAPVVRCPLPGNVAAEPICAMPHQVAINIILGGKQRLMRLVVLGGIPTKNQHAPATILANGTPPRVARGLACPEQLTVPIHPDDDRVVNAALGERTLRRVSAQHSAVLIREGIPDDHPTICREFPVE